jgi:glycosyltransferase involved in cell wall biosynthesis
MTSYNPGPFLRPAIESLLAQTLQDFELVLVEDGSKDGAKDIAQAYAAADARVRLINLPNNIGRTPALNLGLREARSDYVAVLDADDVAAPERLAKQVAVLDSRPQVVAVASHIRFINTDGDVIGTFCPPTDPIELRDALVYNNPFPHSAAMFRRDVAMSIGGYPQRYKYAQDFALWIALSTRGELAMIAEQLVDIREHDARLTRTPTLAATVHSECLELHRSAANLAGVTAEARRRGRITIAVLHYSFARALWLGRRPVAALKQIALSFLAAPSYALRWAMVRGLRLLRIERPKPG